MPKINLTGLSDDELRDRLEEIRKERRAATLDKQVRTRKEGSKPKEKKKKGGERVRDFEDVL